MWTASRDRVERRHRPRHPRPRLPLHARPAWRRGGAPATRRRARRRARRGRPPDDPRARTGRHHPGLGRPRRPAPARPHHHRQPDEHAAAVLGQPEPPATPATPPRPAGTPHSCATTSCARTTRPSTPSTGIRHRRAAARRDRAGQRRRLVLGPRAGLGHLRLQPQLPATPATSRSCEAARRCADYFLAHLPADHVAYWDLDFSDGSGEERDSSAAAIAVCGLLELAEQLPADPGAAALPGRGRPHPRLAHRPLLHRRRTRLERAAPARRLRQAQGRRRRRRHPVGRLLLPGGAHPARPAGWTSPW